MVRPLTTYLAELEHAHTAGELTRGEVDAARHIATQTTRPGGTAELPGPRGEDHPSGLSFAAQVRVAIQKGSGAGASPTPTAPAQPGTVVSSMLSFIAWAVLILGLLGSFIQLASGSEPTLDPYGTGLSRSAGPDFVGMLTTAVSAVVSSVVLFGMSAIIQLLQRLDTVNRQPAE